MVVTRAPRAHKVSNLFDFDASDASVPHLTELHTRAETRRSHLFTGESAQNAPNSRLDWNPNTPSMTSSPLHVLSTP